MACTIKDAWGTEHAIRTVRKKEGRCQYGIINTATRERCQVMLTIGTRYVEGEPDDWSGSPFGMQRWCLNHADYFPSLAKVEVE